MTGFAEHHDDLRAVARDLLGAADPTSGPDWALLAESGWLGLEVPEARGGAGATFAEVAVVLEELGRAATASAYLGSVVLGVGALTLLEPTAHGDELQATVAAGHARVAVGLSSDAETDAPLPFRLSAVDRVEGSASFVVDAREADRLLLPALDAGDRVHLAVVDADASGLTVTPQPVLDATRRLGTVTCDDVEATEVLAFPDDGHVSIRRLRERAAVAVALDSLGLSEAMLAATVTYASDRHQFGRAIGSFQAVKHACADVAVEAAIARELVLAAVGQVAAGERDDGGVAAAMAASYATEAGVRAAGTALQLHGGIGYTWESGIHRYLKRAALNRSLFGAPAGHRRLLAARHAAASRHAR